MKMQDTITFKAALDWIDTGAPFSMAFVTCNKTTNTGGEWIEVAEARKFEFITTAEKVKLAKSQPVTALRKDPNHYQNSTRNIKIEGSDQIRKIHIRLIRKLNGKIVM